MELTSAAAIVVTVMDWTIKFGFLALTKIPYLHHSVQTGSGPLKFSIQQVPILFLRGKAAGS
jgi:hypothetical protein